MPSVGLAIEVVWTFESKWSSSSSGNRLRHGKVRYSKIVKDSQRVKKKVSKYLLPVSRAKLRYHVKFKVSQKRSLSQLRTRIVVWLVRMKVQSFSVAK